MYCENCGALRQAGNAFCTSCGAAVGPVRTAQRTVQLSPAYGVTYPAGVKSSQSGVILSTIACGLAFAQVALALVWTLMNGGLGFSTHGIFVLLRFLMQYGPLAVAAGLLLVFRKNALVGAGFFLGTTFAVFDVPDLLSSPHIVGSLIDIVRMPFAVTAFVCALLAVVKAKPKLSMPSAVLTVVACLAAAFSALTLLGILVTEGAWLMALILLVAVIASIAIGCLLGGRAAASIAIVGGTYFGLFSIQSLLFGEYGFGGGYYNYYGRQYGVWAFLGLLACAAFIATAIIGWRLGKRDEQPELLDPSLLAR